MLKAVQLKGEDYWFKWDEELWDLFLVDSKHGDYVQPLIPLSDWRLRHKVKKANGLLDFDKTRRGSSF